ncbi:MAG: FAD binding domain-containing protein [Hyphomicrobiales bacterium]|nr:FAD binding domain-containing protein [Hyphomicrobiales bacterium]
MKPAAFDYVRAESLDEALDVLAAEGADATILAGGQTLVPMLNMRMARPRVVLDIMRLPGLDRIDIAEGAIRVGATVRQRALERQADLGKHQPLLAAALPWIGHAQTRNRGTVCGSVANADPSAELPLVLVALRGEIELRSRRGARRAAANAFFTGIMSTERKDDELIEAVSFPTAHAGAGYAFREIGRRHGDFAIVACAAVVDTHKARLAIGGVADRPILRELPLPGSADLTDALDAFAADLDARDDLHATAAYRRALVRRLGLQTLQEAAACRA